MDVGQIETRAGLVRDGVREARAGKAKRALLGRIVILVALDVVVDVGGVLVVELRVRLHVMERAVHEVVETVAFVALLEVVVVVVVCHV